MSRLVFLSLIAAAVVLLIGLSIDPDTIVDLVTGRLE